jgi:hypothetical protein
MTEPIIFIAHQKIDWRSTDWRPFLEKLGINWQDADKPVVYV